MVEKSKEVVKTGGEIINLIFEQVTKPETFMNMNPEEFALLKLCANYVTRSNELLIETAEVLERMDKRLEELASK